MRKPELIKLYDTEILYMNFEGLKKPEHIIALEAAEAEYVQKQPYNSVLILANMRNMNFNKDIRNHFIEVTKANSPYIKASAAIGLQGLMATMYNDFIKKTGRVIKCFDNRKDAVRYLVSMNKQLQEKQFSL